MNFQEDNTKAGEIVFSTGNCSEVIKITNDGKFYCMGRLVEGDTEIYKGFVDFLTQSGYYNSSSDSKTLTRLGYYAKRDNVDPNGEYSDILDNLEDLIFGPKV